MPANEIGVWRVNSITREPILVPKYMYLQVEAFVSAAEELNRRRDALRQKCEEAAGTSLANLSLSDLSKYVDLGLAATKENRK